MRIVAVVTATPESSSADVSERSSLRQPREQARFGAVYRQAQQGNNRASARLAHARPGKRAGEGNRTLSEKHGILLSRLTHGFIKPHSVYGQLMTGSRQVAHLLRCYSY